MWRRRTSGTKGGRRKMNECILQSAKSEATVRLLVTEGGRAGGERGGRERESGRERER